MTCLILAAYDTEGVYVYQAFRPPIVQAALQKGTFEAGFSLDRMTWIKPSFGWMLYRSSYGTKPDQEAILKIKLTHAGFGAILAQSVESTFDPASYESRDVWQRAVAESEVRHQWDPDRLLNGDKHADRRAIQIGLRGAAVRQYVDEWIIGLEDVTALAHAVHDAVRNKGNGLPEVPEERVYPVDAPIARRLGITAE